MVDNTELDQWIEDQLAYAELWSKKFFCTICGKNEVFPAYGEDTCSQCLRAQ